MELGLGEIVLIVVIALLLFGPSKFAGLARGIGEGIKNFKSSLNPGEKKDRDEKKS
jgi:sec-independent protein translocase protein TatA